MLNSQEKQKIFWTVVFRKTLKNVQLFEDYSIIVSLENILKKATKKWEFDIIHIFNIILIFMDKPPPLNLKSIVPPNEDR